MHRLIAITSVLVAAAGSASAGSAVTISQGYDPAVTDGDVIVDANPDAVFAAFTDYRRWTEVMPDIARVEIKDQNASDAHVTLISPSGHRDNLHFHNRPESRTIFFEDTGNHGAEVWAEIGIQTADPGQTRIHLRLYAKVHGIATIVVRDGAVRAKREHIVATDLTHIRDYFGRISVR